MTIEDPSTICSLKPLLDKLLGSHSLELAIERVTKEVVQNVLPQHIDSSKAFVDHHPDTFVFLADALQILKAGNDRTQDARHCTRR
jgi:hypothetical protein